MSAEGRDTLKEAVSSKVDYQGFCDAIASVFREGVFQVHLGQTQPTIKEMKWVARLWIDPKSYKKFTQVFRTQLELYEKKFGEIKI